MGRAHLLQAAHAEPEAGVRPVAAAAHRSSARRERGERRRRGEEADDAEAQQQRRWRQHMVRCHRCPDRDQPRLGSAGESG